MITAICWYGVGALVFFSLSVLASGHKKGMGILLPILIGLLWPISAIVLVNSALSTWTTKKAPTSRSSVESVVVVYGMRNVLQALIDINQDVIRARDNDPGLKYVDDLNKDLRLALDHYNSRYDTQH